MAAFNLVIANAIRYYGEGHEFGRKALDKQAWFQQRMKKLPIPIYNRADMSTETPGRAVSPSLSEPIGGPVYSRLASEELSTGLPISSVILRRETVQPHPQRKKRKVSYVISDTEYDAEVSS